MGRLVSHAATFKIQKGANEKELVFCKLPDHEESSDNATPGAMVPLRSKRAVC